IRQAEVRPAGRSGGIAVPAWRAVVDLHRRQAVRIAPDHGIVLARRRPRHAVAVHTRATRAGLGRRGAIGAAVFESRSIRLAGLDHAFPTDRARRANSLSTLSGGRARVAELLRAARGNERKMVALGAALTQIAPLAINRIAGAHDGHAHTRNARFRACAILE